MVVMNLEKYAEMIEHLLSFSDELSNEIIKNKNLSCNM